MHQAFFALMLLTTADPLADWNTLEKGVRDGRITETNARPKVTPVLKALAEKYPLAPARKWAFPIRKGSIRWIGGKHGEGFRPRSPRPAYSWYHGNRHGGHPAHDVFIARDKNRDCKRDDTGQEYIATSMQRAVVISINVKFKPGEPRGGMYVWLYQPKLDLLIYYAHLNRVDVKPGDILEPGDPLGTVGNTGFGPKNAHKPCHIHLMALKAGDGVMKPYDYFKDLGGKR